MTQEDKKLQALLQQLAVEETDSDFTLRIMQRIEINTAAEKQAAPLFQQKLLKGLLGAFIIVAVILLVCCAKEYSVSFPVYLTSSIPANYISQLTSFIVVFWIVMLTNQIYQRKHKQFV